MLSNKSGAPQYDPNLKPVMDINQITQILPHRYPFLLIDKIIHLDDTTSKNGALKVIPGSHNKRVNDEEIRLISSNSIPFVSEISSGGVQLLKPLLLHASSKTTVQKRRRVLHLEFSSIELPNGLEYAEREDL